jgi:CrcB protein
VTLVGVLAAGALGALARYLVDGAVQDRVEGIFPWGTLAVNVSGSLVLGVVAGLALYHGLPGMPTSILGAGFCGAYTTFSTFAYETVRLAEEGSRASALVNVMASMALGLAAAALGLSVAAAAV